MVRQGAMNQRPTAGERAGPGAGESRRQRPEPTAPAARAPAAAGRGCEPVDASARTTTQIMIAATPHMIRVNTRLMRLQSAKSNGFIVSGVTRGGAQDTGTACVTSCD